MPKKPSNGRPRLPIRSNSAVAPPINWAFASTAKSGAPMPGS